MIDSDKIIKILLEKISANNFLLKSKYMMSPISNKKYFQKLFSNLP